MRYLLFLSSFISVAATAQQLSIPQVLQVTQWNTMRADSLLKEQAFVLAQKDRDSVSQLRYYTSLERNPDATSWIRSVTLMDAQAKGYTGRMVTYRTYNKAEYNQWLQWLLENGYQTIKNYTAGTEQYTIYRNGKQEFLIRRGEGELAKNKKARFYELETGR